MDFLFLVLTLLASPSPSPGLPGTVSGRVTLVKNGAPQPDSSNTVVWIEGAQHAGATTPVQATMKSEKKRFTPRAVVVSRRGIVNFPNMDAIYHNVFSVSGGNRFDLGLYRAGASKEKMFEEPGLVRVYCNIHPTMVGFVMVVDSDFSAVTPGDGSFRFEGVPAGSYTLKVWHEEAGEKSVTISVRSQSSTDVPVQLDVSGFTGQAHKNKYGKDYPPPPPDDERY
jgi:plastocyanin